jgi:hypothetical protein
VKSGRLKTQRPTRASARRKAASRAKTRATQRNPRRKVKAVSSKNAKARAVSRARATTPARATHAKKAVVRPEPLQHPMPTRHVAPTRPVLVAPARSMPPARDQRKPVPQPVRGPLAVPEFAEAGVVLAITYSIREGRRGEFFDLMRELKPMLVGIGGHDCTVYEDRSRPNYFMEVFRFKDETEFTAFDDKFHKDRKIAAIYALLDDIVEAEKSDFKIFERRL